MAQVPRVLLDPHSSHILITYINIINLLHICPCQERDPSSVAVCLRCLPFLVFLLQEFFRATFSLLEIELEFYDFFF